MFHSSVVRVLIAIVAVALLGIAEASAETWIQYSNDFQGTVGPEWSNTTTSVTPAGGRRFLGQFGAQTVTLTLNDVRIHGGVRVTFDLFIIGSWDGNYVSPTAGPDIWDLSAPNSPTSLHTTFNTHTFAEQYQAYPDSYPGGQHPSNTGAAEVGTLGYSCSGSCTNAVYHIDLTFEHTSHTMVLNFSASNLEAIANESWGIDNVVVYANSPLPPDWDDDGDLDQYDVMYFMLCSSGPGLPPRDFPECILTDLDGDGDSDMDDFGMVQRCYGGEGVTPLSYCAD